MKTGENNKSIFSERPLTDMFGHLTFVYENSGKKCSNYKFNLKKIKIDFSNLLQLKNFEI